MNKTGLSLLSMLLALLLSNCSDPKKTTETQQTPPMDSLTERYVKLVLRVGQHSADFVDAYYGPEDWKPAPLDSSKKEAFPAEALSQEAESIRQQLSQIDFTAVHGLDSMRQVAFQKQLHAVQTYISLLAGKKLPFDEESKNLYDAVAPTHDEAYFAELLGDLEKELPGKGALSERLESFKKSYIIPKEKLDTVFTAAITEARKRTLTHIPLPANESFKVEYVTGKSWSGYNYYKGNSFSLIQVNTDLPIYIDRAIDLACHEGYPGHHVYNALLEKNLVRDHKWLEFSVYPLFSPQSLIAEGSANYGIEVAFPGEERIKFEREVLFPLAGIDPAKVDAYYRLQNLTKGLSYAGNEAARNYLDGKITKEQAVEWLTKYALYAPERARQRLKFIEQYRSYVINYNLGQDIVKAYIERNGGTADQPDKRWTLFSELLSKPFTPSGLQKK